MPDNTDELKTRPGKFLEVERTADGYIETTVTGEQRHYTLKVFSQSIRLEELTIHSELDLTTGQLRPSIRGKTADNFRALGTEGEYPIFDVEVTSGGPSPNAKIIGKYTLDGHCLRMALGIFLPEPAVLTLASELRAAKSSRQRVVIEFETGGFFRRDGGANVGVVILPYWGDQAHTQSTGLYGTLEYVVVEWPLVIERVSIRHPHLGAFE